MYITASSTISHQPSFQNEGFSTQLNPLPPHSNIIHPDYNPFIPPMRRRRMTDVLKMAITCAVDSLAQVGLNQPEGIIVGTSMGCNNFTKKFLDKIVTSKGRLLSPTSFILSTHNTIAGQISLLLKNTCYNMTHTQNSLSFEHALTDAKLCIQEGADHILVGAADEMENDLYNLNTRLTKVDYPITCGASFFILSKNPSDPGSVSLLDVSCSSLIDDLKKPLHNFLLTNDLRPGDLDVLLYSSSSQKTFEDLSQLFPASRLVDFQKYSGTYFTNSSFACHYAIDLLLEEKKVAKVDTSKILIVNNLIPENLGLILIEITNEVIGKTTL